MRTFIESFERGYSSLHSRSIRLLEMISDVDLYRRPRELSQTFAMFTVGEYLLRSAASVEQTFGGITTRLWDDPFEWTLPEKLATTEFVREYLTEVDITAKSGFSFLQSDDDLGRQMPAPTELKPIFQILLETLARAEHYEGRAFAVFQMISDEKLPKF
jgi:hypothetical protein